MFKSIFNYFSILLIKILIQNDSILPFWEDVRMTNGKENTRHTK